MAIHALRCAILLIAVSCTPSLLLSHDPISTKLTWSREISRILTHRCLTCHQSGGSAFSLSSYVEARPWAVAIREEVGSRRMPPWNAVHGFGGFSADPSLSQEEIQLITDWVNGGAPEGDPRLLAPAGRPPAVKPQTPNGSPILAANGKPLAGGTLNGFRVLALPARGDTRLLIQRPDGRLQPLAWLRAFSPHAPSVYSFSPPVTVLPGSTLRLWAPPGARLELISSPSPNPPSKLE